MSKGTDRRSIRIDADLWDKLGAYCQAHGVDRSALIRRLITEHLEGGKK